MTSGERATGSLRPELITDEFEVAFDYFWSQLADGMEILWSQEKLAARRSQAMQKELLFYNRVYDAVEAAMIKTDGPVLCLFDIDGTLAEVKGDEESPVIHTLLRPAAQPLISSLAVKYPEKLRFGILSVRPEESLQEEVANPTFLYPVRPFLDPNLVISSDKNHESRNDKILRGEYDDTFLYGVLKSLRGIIDANILTETYHKNREPIEWYDTKLLVLGRLLEQYAQATVILVDDLPCGEQFDKTNPRLYGVGVADCSQLLVP